MDKLKVLIRCFGFPFWDLFRGVDPSNATFLPSRHCIRIVPHPLHSVLYQTKPQLSRHVLLKNATRIQVLRWNSMLLYTVVTVVLPVQLSMSCYSSGGSIQKCSSQKDEKTDTGRIWKGTEGGMQFLLLPSDATSSLAPAQAAGRRRRHRILRVQAARPPGAAAAVREPPPACVSVLCQQVPGTESAAVQQAPSREVAAAEFQS